MQLKRGRPRPRGRMLPRRAPARPEPGGVPVTQVAPHSAPSGRSDRAPRGARHRSASPPPEPAPDPEGTLRGRHATSYGQGFGGVVRWTILGSILPGAGLVAAGRKTAGRALLALTFLVVTALVCFALFTDTTSFALGALGLALLWALVVIGTHVSLRRFATLTTLQRVLSTALVVAIVAGGGMIAAKTASYSLIGRDTLQAITSNGTQIPDAPRPKNNDEDPWA